MYQPAHTAWHKRSLQDNTMNMKKGTLYGIGVGPGDAELITVKAVRLLNKVDIIFTASSTKNTFSLAVEIAKPHLPETTGVRTLSFPMTRDKEVMAAAWKENAEIIVKEIEAGRNVAFLTLGDPLTYSTFGYVLQVIQRDYPQVDIVTVPGITSYQAAASRINTPLVEGEESLLITSGVYGGDNVRKCNGSIENVVLLKAYKNIASIAEVLEESDMLENSTAISKCGRKDEEINVDVKALSTKKPDYWTLIIAKKDKADKEAP